MNNIIKIHDLINDKSKLMIIFDILNQLTDSPLIEYENLIKIINNLNNNHLIFVYLLDNIPVALITLFIEQKLIHGGKCVGHIEDLVVDNKYTGKGIASKLINHCLEICKNNNCYKTILDCDEKLLQFYENNEFKQQGICMRNSYKF